MQFRRSQLEMTDDYGNLFLKTNDFKGALKIYQTALEQLSHDDRISAGAFISYARGKMEEDIGDCYLGLANRPAVSQTEKITDLKTAESFYLKAGEDWQSPEVRRGYFSRTPETLEYLAEKLSRAKHG